MLQKPTAARVNRQALITIIGYKVLKVNFLPFPTYDKSAENDFENVENQFK